MFKHAYLSRHRKGTLPLMARQRVTTKSMPSPPCIPEQYAMKRRMQAFSHSRFLVELLRGILVSGNARVLVSSETATPKLPRPRTRRNPCCLRRRTVGRRRGDGVWWAR